VKELYSRFDNFGNSTESHFQNFKFSRGCRDALKESLSIIAAKTQQFAKVSNSIHLRDYNFIKQINERVVVAAVHYYRTMFEAGPDTRWEIRDEVICHIRCSNAVLLMNRFSISSMF
jgi:hypothetical protein